MIGCLDSMLHVSSWKCDARRVVEPPPPRAVLAVLDKALLMEDSAVGCVWCVSLAG
jgi:hypothetical protein